MWEKVLEAVVDDPDFEWLMIDATHVKAHHDATGSAGGPRVSVGQRELNVRIHMAVDAFAIPTRFLVTEGIVADCSAAPELVHGLTAEHLLTDKDYDAGTILPSIIHTRCHWNPSDHTKNPSGIKPLPVHRARASA